MIPSAFYSFHRISFNPNFKRPIPSQKWILKQQVRIQLSIPKHSTKITCPCTPLPSPRQSHSQNDPKTLPGPRPLLRVASTLAPAEISCSTTAAWPSPAARCSAVQPRAARMRRGRSSSCGCRRETKRIVMGCFSGLLGKILNIGHKYSKYLTALLSKFVPYGDHNFKDKCGIKHKIIKKKSSEHFETT